MYAASDSLFFHRPPFSKVKMRSPHTLSHASVSACPCVCNADDYDYESDLIDNSELEQKFKRKAKAKHKHKKQRVAGERYCGNRLRGTLHALCPMARMHKTRPRVQTRTRARILTFVPGRRQRVPHRN